MADTSLVFNLVARDRATSALERIREKFATSGVAIGKGFAAGFGAGVAPAVVAAAAGLAVSIASAGIAVKAFTAAAQPQLESVTNAWDLYSAAQAAAAEGGEQAAAAQKQLDDAMAQMPAATRDTATAFIGLKQDFSDWSDSLSGSTMPVFTKGIQILRDLLPQLTPFVEAAAGALGGFLDEVAAGVQSAGFKQWASDLSTAAGPTLTSFLTVIKNLAIGVGGLVQAFVPATGQMNGSLVSLSQSFADWGAQLKDSEGFAQFMALAQKGAGTLGGLAMAAGNLLVALGPLIGITTQVALTLANIVNALPPSVLSTLATSIVAVTIAWKAYKATAAAVSTAQDLLGSNAARMAGRWVKSAARATASFARIAARATVSAARTAAVWAAAAAKMAARWLAQLVRVAIRTAAQFVMMAARAVVWAATMAAQWIIAMGPVGWIIAAVVALVALIILNWDKIKQWTAAAWNWIWTKIKQFAQFIWNFFLNWTIVGNVIKHWDAIKSKTAAIWNAVVNWVKAIPGRLVNLFLKWTIVGNVIRHWDQIKSGTARVWNSVVGWVRGIPGRIVNALGNLGSLLFGKGMDIVRGLWNGIKSMGGWLRDTLMGWARNLIPGPIARALGIASPSKVLADEVGRWIPAGISMGITSNLDEVKAAANLAADAAVPPPSVTSAGAFRVPAPRPLMAASAKGQQVNVVFDVQGADEDMKKMIRKMVRVDGRGDVQMAFGR